MKLFDKILLFLVSCCISFILIIFLTSYISPKYASVIPKSSEPPSDPQVIVYGEEIDNAISQYFESIRANPAEEEETKRLVDGTKKDAQNSKKKIVGISKVKKSTNYTVRPGESLWNIANKFNIPVYTITSANPKVEKNIIHPGDVLHIPSQIGLYYKVRNGDTLGKIAKTYRLSLSNVSKYISPKLKRGERIFLRGAKPLPTTRYRYISRFIWPLRGKLTSSYGWRRHPILGKRHFHTGMDISAKWGTSIKAVAKGIIIHAGSFGAYGKTVIVRHKNKYISVYAHCSSIRVRKGTVVQKGTRIARVGNTGRSTGSHLHFEIKHKKSSINPRVALRLKERVPI